MHERSRQLTLLLTASALFTALLWTSPARAQVAQPAPASQRQVEITASTPGARVVVDRFGPFNPGQTYGLPTTLSLDGNAHSLAIRRAGFETARISVPAGAQNLMLDVQMSRPVFQAGIALTVIGGLMTIAGLWLVADYYAEVNSPDTVWDQWHVRLCEADPVVPGFPGCWTRNPTHEVGFPVMGVGLGALVAGIVMIVLDRHRRPTWTWGGQATP
jgi:hypothetical protein